MPQNTNLNVNPYFDDFDKNKKFNKVLFKPGTPVQARELTTLQSILQDQIEKFGQHMFKEGSVVIPGSVAYDDSYYAVKLESTFFGVPVESYFDQLVGLEIKGKASGVTAVVKSVLKASKSTQNCTTLYVKYRAANANDKTTQTFQDGENLITLSDFTFGSTTTTAGSDFATCILKNATSTGSAFTVVEGVFFARGAFVQVDTETIVLDQYSNNPSYRVGFQVIEEIITAVEDDSLYDNAAGFSNYTAPGADRLKISLKLTKKALDNFQDENFIELFRTNKGEIKKIVVRTVYNELAKELARRTFDESGDYFVTPFSFEPKESLNDRHSQFGVFFPEESTDDNNVPSKDIASIKVGPGKAYVKGYEVETFGATFVDSNKPRETELVESSTVPFQAGNLIRVNNVYGGASVGIATTGYVDLRSNRLGTDRDEPAGQSVGRARVYDFKLSAGAYADATSSFDLFLFDVQTDTEITLNNTLSISAPALVEGKRSGARGFLRSQTGNILTLHQTAGQFVQDEAITVDGIDNGRIITKVTEFGVNDIHSIRQEVGVQTFSGDTVLEPRIVFGGQSFNFTAAAGSKSTVSSSSNSWTVGIQTGDIIQYNRSGITGSVFNRVKTVSPLGTSIEVEAVANVSDVCTGSIPSAATNVSGLSVVSPIIRNSQSGFLFADMPDRNVESVDLTRSDIFVRGELRGRSSNSLGTLDLPSLSGTDFVYAPFDEERYTVLYEDGTIEPLTTDQFVITGGGKGVTLSGLTASKSNIVVHVTKQKVKVVAKDKDLKRCETIVVSGSKYTYSGISTSIGDGLTYNLAYGKRVQDREVSLDTADVVRVRAVFESSSNADPTIPSLTFTGLNGPNADNSDLIKGESVIGKVSGASALILGTTGTQSAFIVSSNEGNFIEGEEISFTESKVGGKISSATLGDKEISANFILDNGQRAEFYDFGRLIRRQGAPEPSGRIKVFFDKFVINSEDSGELVTASSYGADVYDIVPSFRGTRNTDVVDMRPRVADYNSALSPFEWGARVFSGSGQSVANVLVSDENITFDYKYYLGRIDRLFLNSDSTFTLVEGTPARSPQLPEGVDSSFELAEITYAPYVFDVNRDITIETRGNKRYTMKDIGGIEKRIENVEFATSLSLLEAKTEALVVKDPDTGLDSFKTGFAVDNFSNFALADTSLPELKYDVEDGVAVARANYDVVDLLIGSESLIGLSGVPNNAVDVRYATDLGSQNVTKKGSKVLLNYTQVVDFDQPFASRVVNVNPYDVVTWFGQMKINPTEDVWVERRFNSVDGGFGVTEVITETEAIPNLRSQNIEFTGYRLKPGTKFYSSFSRTDMSDQRSLTVPKLLEVTPVKGAFQVGETVSGKLLNNQNSNTVPEIRFRVATPNHKDGPYNAPTLVYESSPYDGAGISSSYSDTSTLINVDTGSLNQKSDERFFGTVVKDMRLVGETSNAEAQVKEVRLISDGFGALQGSIHIPSSNPNFTNGSNTVGLSAAKGDVKQVPGELPISKANANFFSRGELITQTTINRVAPPPPPPPPDDDDPLAQSFNVTEYPGIYMTSVDMFFFTKSSSIPVEVRIVHVENGYPTKRTIASKILEPSQVNTSDNGTVATNFEFDFPVYLAAGEYAFVILASTQEYQAWICRVGEDDILTRDLPELAKVVISKQPSTGSLFKSQNASTWTASQLEDLKYKAYKAKFITGQGTFKMYNPELQTFNQRNLLPSNPIEVFDKKVTVGLSSDLKNPHIVVGTQIKQNNRTSSGFVEGKLGAVGAANTGFSITNAGIGYSNTTFGAVNFTTLTGNGSGATGIVTVSSGTVDSVCVLNTGSGYQVGDTVTATLGSNNLGRNLVLTVGVVTSTNALKLTGVTGQDFNTSELIQYVPSGGSGVGLGSTLASITPTSVTINADEFDGKHVRVSHPNHGMHAFNNKVDLTRVEGDTIPTNITVGYGASSIENISIGSSSNFGIFEGSQVSTTNPGFALIGNEIIAYTGVGNNVLTGITTRGVDGTTTQSFLPGTPIQKYEFKGVSLRELNKEHSFADVTNAITEKIGLDHYFLKIGGTKTFTSHSLGGGVNARASQNVQFEAMTPNLKHTLPDNTSISASARTTSGTSISGSETSFQDRGYQPVSLGGETKFADPRIIASRVNESDKLSVLPGAKSFTLDVTIGSTNENVSPVVDVFDSNITVKSSRVNAPISNYVTDRRSNTLLEDPHTFSYVTSVIGLENPASSLKVILAAFKPGTSDIRVLYRLRRTDGSDIDKVFELMPGFNNIDINGKVIDGKNNDGTSDRQISNSVAGQFLEHQFTANGLPQFSGYQIKVEVTSTNQAQSPSIRDFRVIALA
jgi:hypothetical protein